MEKTSTEDFLLGCIVDRDEEEEERDEDKAEPV